MNEEFFNKLFPDQEIKTEEEFRAKIAEIMSQSFINDTDKQFMNEAIIKVVDSTPIPLPDEFVKRFLLVSNEGKLKKPPMIL